MADTLATRQDLREVKIRLDELEKRIDIRFREQTAQLRGEMVEQTAQLRREMIDLERRLTMRLGGIMVAGITIVSALVKLL